MLAVEPHQPSGVRRHGPALLETPLGGRVWVGLWYNAENVWPRLTEFLGGLLAGTGGFSAFQHVGSRPLCLKHPQRTKMNKPA